MRGGGSRRCACGRGGREGLAAQAEWQCFPKTVDDLKPVLDFAAKWGGHHICLQPDVRPRRFEDCVPLLESWLRLSEQSPIPVWIETHRDRMTTDLYFTLDLLEAFPTMELVADLSHYLVGREFAWPVSAENHGYVNSILDRSRALHGRVASREQVQIEISFAHHKPLVDQFLDWWKGRCATISFARRTRRRSHSIASWARGHMRLPIVTVATRRTDGLRRCNCETSSGNGGGGCRAVSRHLRLEEHNGGNGYE